MIPFDYLVLRLIRRFLPSPIVHWAMKVRLGVEPGLETRDPATAGDRYVEALRSWGRDVQGKRIMILGYGGYFGLAVDLLGRGAAHIVLFDPYARINHEKNLALAQGSSPFLFSQNDRVIPNDEYITIMQDLDPEYHPDMKPLIDCVFSSSVLEHVSHPGELIQQLGLLTAREGFHIHFIDLRDHFFKYPFEMLCHSELVWSRLLNPSSNLNRMRVWDYEHGFKGHFRSVEIDIFERELGKFRQTKARIKPEFISGTEEVDCATRVLVSASNPKWYA
jgi:hypothetical protein